METIFDYNPTPSELDDIRFDSLSFCQKFGINLSVPLTRELYLQHITQDFAYYDLACLFEFRDQMIKAQEYWDKLPVEFQHDGLGDDYQILAV